MLWTIHCTDKTNRNPSWNSSWLSKLIGQIFKMNKNILEKQRLLINSFSKYEIFVNCQSIRKYDVGKAIEIDVDI
jgi:hypothetical protein